MFLFVFLLEQNLNDSKITRFVFGNCIYRNISSLSCDYECKEQLGPTIAFNIPGTLTIILLANPKNAMNRF